MTTNPFDGYPHLHVVIDPATSTPQSAIDWFTAFEELSGLRMLPAPGKENNSTAGDAKDDISKQLNRLQDHNPVFADRIQTLHDGLVALGYQPTVPVPRKPKEQLPSYLNYVDPVTGRNFGNANSQRLYIMRGELKSVLKDKPHVSTSGRYASIALLSDAAVNFALEVAKGCKAN